MLLKIIEDENNLHKKSVIVSGLMEDVIDDNDTVFLKCKKRYFIKDYLRFLKPENKEEMEFLSAVEYALSKMSKIIFFKSPWPGTMLYLPEETYIIEPFLCTIRDKYGIFAKEYVTYQGNENQLRYVFSEFIEKIVLSSDIINAKIFYITQIEEKKSLVYEVSWGKDNKQLFTKYYDAINSIQKM